MSEKSCNFAADLVTTKVSKGNPVRFWDSPAAVSLDHRGLKLATVLRHSNMGRRRPREAKSEDLPNRNLTALEEREVNL